MYNTKNYFKVFLSSFFSFQLFLMFFFFTIAWMLCFWRRSSIICLFAFTSFLFLPFFWTQIDMSNVLIYIKFWAKKIFIASTNSFHLKLNRAVEDFLLFCFLLVFFSFSFKKYKLISCPFTKKLKHFFISFWIIVRNYLITI